MKTIIDKMKEKGFRPFTSLNWQSYAAAEGQAMIMSGKNYDFVYSEPEGDSNAALVLCHFCVDCEDFPMCGYFTLNNPVCIDYECLKEDIDRVINESPRTHCIALEKSMEDMLKTTYGIELIC